MILKIQCSPIFHFNYPSHYSSPINALLIVCPLFIFGLPDLLLRSRRISLDAHLKPLGFLRHLFVSDYLLDRWVRRWLARFLWRFEKCHLYLAKIDLLSSRNQRNQKFDFRLHHAIWIHHFGEHNSKLSGNLHCKGSYL